MIAILDYGAGNIQSVKNALDKLNVDSIVTNDLSELEKADKMIIPGVGNFKQFFDFFDSDYVDKLKQILQTKPTLGICLGMQILFEESEEAPGVKGLGLIKGKVKRFTEGKVPQIGWNKVNLDYFYFVNSYYCIPEEGKITNSEYYINFCSIINKQNLTGFQFHPEKSGKKGLEMLRCWLNE
ncbi:MAG: imidazole glycerol phosphate synthase subunit HisH [Nanoarchaeota archaeon]|nr:imidazole glycerol phosphate synthase subunit HisH [Nanoarchaeota archaeon]MBU1704899.1 imidazole glycerol phosphate synthase subunit HisH [Nanoarchaeota archaeon]